MRQLIAILLVVIALLSGCAKGAGDTKSEAAGDYGCSAWLPYWDADAALEEAHAFPDRYESLICFEAFFDENGDWLLPPESEQILEGLRDVDAPVYLSLVNDVRRDDGSFVLKSPDFLRERLLSPDARRAHIGQILELVRETGAEGLEIDYENFRKDAELWSAFSVFLAELYETLLENGVRLRVVMECSAPKYAVFPEGPVYSCMCYNLYGSHSGPGPKADREFLEELGESWKAVPGEVHMAFASGGYLWAGDKAEKSLTEQQAQSWLEQNGAKAKRDEDSGALRAVVRDGKKHTVWYADGETLALWRDTLRAMGYTHFDLFRLGGNTADSLGAFLGAH